MALDLLTTTAFERDLRRIKKQGKDLGKLEGIGRLGRTRMVLYSCPAERQEVNFG